MCYKFSFNSLLTDSAEIFCTKIILQSEISELPDLYGIIFAMEHARTETFDMRQMIADYMENGCLDNIVDMFKHDESLYAYTGDLLKDERMRVRIGVIALMETLKKEAPGKVKKALPPILPLLKEQNPVVMGDAAYVLGIIGDKEAVPFLKEIANAEDANVRLIVKEALDDIRRTLDMTEAAR